MLKVFDVTFQVETDEWYTEELVEDAIRRALDTMPTTPYIDYNSLTVVQDTTQLLEEELPS